jgi:hypothetical protein
MKSNVTRIASDADIDRIAQGLIERSLPRVEWTHAAHFAAALWLLERRGTSAYIEMPRLIRSYNETCGVENSDTGGYHETITLASLRVGAAWLANRPGVPLHAALNELLESPCGRSGWLLRHYSRELLFSTTARREWVEPDLQPLTL